MSPAELLAIRTNLQLTQAEMAVVVGVKPRQYSNYERGMAEIPQKIVNGATLAQMNRAANVRKLDGRFRKPKNWEAEHGKPVYMYVAGVGESVEGLLGALKGDPCRRPRAKTREAAEKACQQPAADRPYPWGAPVKVEEHPNGWHVWLEGSNLQELVTW